MNILIKSFNRPYLLDFTIKSALKNIKGNFTITVVDDGTPDIYLQKLIKRYPFVNFKKTKYYKEKSTRIINHEINNLIDKKITLPHSDWNNIVNEFDSDFFLVLEDDQYIINEIDITVILELFKKYNLQFIHFNVLNNKSINFKILDEINNVYIYNSKYLLRKIRRLNEIISPNYFQRKFNGLLKKLRIDNKLDFKKDLLELYNIYVISGVIYRKSYWNICTSTSKDEVNEIHQLYSAGIYNLSYKGKLFFGVSQQQRIKTNFNNTSLGNNRGLKFDTTLFNILMNKIWYKDDTGYFDETNYELNVNYVINYLKKENNTNCSFEEWVKFSEIFKNNYKSMGFDL